MVIIRVWTPREFLFTGRCVRKWPKEKVPTRNGGYARLTFQRRRSKTILETINGRNCRSNFAPARVPSVILSPTIRIPENFVFQTPSRKTFTPARHRLRICSTLSPGFVMKNGPGGPTVASSLTVQTWHVSNFVRNTRKRPYIHVRNLVKNLTFYFFLPSPSHIYIYITRVKYFLYFCSSTAKSENRKVFKSFRPLFVARRP